MSVLAALALGLAVGGVFITTHYSVLQRTRKFGIRMSVGAGPVEIISLVLRRSSVLIAVGIVADLVLALLIIPSLATDWRELRHLGWMA